MFFVTFIKSMLYGELTYSSLFIHLDMKTVIITVQRIATSKLT